MAFNPAASGSGTNNILGVWNAYNRVGFSAKARDSTTTWTYASATWRSSHNLTANRISFVDGLQQSPINGTFQCMITGSSTVTGAIGMSLDSTSAAPATTAQLGGGTLTAGVVAADNWPAQLGFHFVQAMEVVPTANTCTFTGSGTAPTRQFHSLQIALDM